MRRRKRQAKDEVERRPVLWAEIREETIRQACARAAEMAALGFKGGDLYAIAWAQALQVLTAYWPLLADPPVDMLGQPRILRIQDALLEVQKAVDEAGLIPDVPPPEKPQRSKAKRQPDIMQPELPGLED